ncbi:hypothetical protein CC86DRAFT_465487 [Ophiobolus disseminans]|uniref:Uncharacterized protein n=1 Tax=Ophiobolus disseminans TaxID=1469910 RepID=A0A6A7A6F4_9PLEO|nr:hypothetical protein CC86DRAFT_465487 [Ophiobolus disseminans]
MKSKNVVYPSELTELTPERGDETAKGSRQLLRSIRAADWWVWEILSLVVSAISLAAIVLLLSTLNNKPQPLWASTGRYCIAVPGTDQTVCRRSGITVNSVVSWLGTLARVCLLVPLSNGLGQLKWSWFSDGKARTLADLDTFDAASRGLTGSMQLIWLLKARYLAAFGALGMIISIAFDPFVQNLVGYHTKLVLVPGQSAFVANSNKYQAQTYATNNYIIINPSLKASIFSALYSYDARRAWSEPYHVCGTGDCTWPPIASIGICTSCWDTTASVKKDCVPPRSPSEYNLNCSLSLSSSGSSGDLTYLPEVSLSYRSGEGITPNGKFFAISSTGGKADTRPRKVASIYVDLNQQDLSNGKKGHDSEPAFKSSRCTISPCIQSIQSTYKQTDQTPYQEKLLKSWTAEDLTPKPLLSSVLPAPTAPEYGLFGNQTYSIEALTHSGLFNFLGDTLNGYYERSGGDYYKYPWSDNDNDAVFALWHGNYTGCAEAYKDNRVSCGLDFAAKAMSKTFRDAAYIANGTYGNGDAFASVIHVNVTWYWMTLPVLMWIFAFTTFLGMVWKASEPGSKTWRNSVLPMVFMSVEEGGEDRVVRDASVEQGALKRRAEALRGVMDVSERGVRFKI